MALFEVPGWSVPAAPVESSKKRKRPPGHDGGDKVLSEVSLERVPKKSRLGHDPESETSALKQTPTKSRTTPKKDTRKGKERRVAFGASKTVARELAISGPQPLQKMKKTAGEVAEKSSSRLTLPQQSKRGFSEALSLGLTSLQKGMKQSLDGARFR
jgi:ribosomal RNA-processing protein 8